MAITWRFERVLCIGAHLDDCEFGCGGFLARYAGKAEIRVLGLSTRTRSSTGEVQIVRDVEEAYRGVELLGLSREAVVLEGLDGQLFQEQRQQLREILLDWSRRYEPDLILCPPVRDIHQDHQVAGEEACRIFRRRTVLGYEILNSSYDFTPTLFLPLSPAELERKVDAVMSYKSQQVSPATAAYYFDSDMIRGLAHSRGAKCGSQAAEAFEVYFMNPGW